jgi:hypothetical protein
MRGGRIASVMVGWLVALLGASTALAQQPPTQPEFHYTPWAGVALGLGGVRADCACGFDYGGGSLTASLSAGIDLSRSISLGVEETGFAVIITDGPNSASVRTITARYSSRGPLLIGGRIGVGWATYRAGSQTLFANRLAFHAGIELGRRRGGVETAQSLMYYTSVSGPGRVLADSSRVRYHLRATNASGAFRYHFY